MKSIFSKTAFRGLLRKLRAPHSVKIYHFKTLFSRLTQSRVFVPHSSNIVHKPVAFFAARGLVVILAVTIVTQTGLVRTFWRDVIKPTPALATSITVSGKFYSDEGVTPWDCSFNRTIWVSVNGGAPVSGLCTGADGSYSVSGVSIANPGDTVFVYLEPGMFGDNSITVTRTLNGSSNLTGIDIYENHTVLRHEDAGPLTIADLAKFDSNSDPFVPYTVISGNFYGGCPWQTIYVWPGKSFTPGGQINLEGANGGCPVHVAHNATLTIDTAATGSFGTTTIDDQATLNINADMNAYEILTAGSATVTTTSGTPTVSINSNFGTFGGGSSSLTFYDLSFSPYVTPTLGSNIIIHHNLTLPDAGQGGSFSSNGKSITFTGTSVPFDGSGYTFDNITYDPPSSGTMTVTNHALLLNGTLTVGSHGTLALNGFDFDSVANGAINVQGTISGAGIVHIKNSSLSTGGTISSTVVYDSSSSTSVPARTFGGNLILQTPNSPSFITLGTSSGQSISVGGSLTLFRSGGGIIDGSINNPGLTITGSLLTDYNNGFTVGVNMGSGTWTVGGDVDFTKMGTLNTNGGTLVMNGTGTLTSNGKTLSNFTVTGSGTVTFANTTHTFDGNLTLGSSVTLINGTSQFVMTGTSKTIDGGGKFLNALRIAGSISLQNNLTLTNNSVALQIDNGKTLTINNGQNLIMTGFGSANPSLVVNGTINGGGRLQIQDPQIFTTNGTISCIVLFDTKNGNVSIPQRTFGGDVEIYGNTNNARTVTLGTAGSQTLNIGGSLKVIADVSQAQSLTLTGATWNPIMNITGGVSMTKSGSGTPAITTGTNTWTISGDLDLSNGTFTATPLNTIVMNGAGKTLTGANGTLYRLTISNTSSTISLSGSDVTISTTFTVSGSGGNFTVLSGRILTVGVNGTMVLNGTLSGPGKLYYLAGGTFPSSGTLANSLFLRIDTSGAIATVAGRSDFGSIEVYNQSGASRTFTPTGSYTLSGNLDIIAATSGSDMIINGNIFSPTFTITGNLTNSQNNATTTLNMGSSTWTVGGNVDFSHLTTLNSSTSTLAMNGTGTFTSNGKTLNNFSTSGTGTITLANATHTFGGNISFGSSATINAGSSTIVMSALNRTMTFNGQTIANLTTTASTSILDAAALSGNLLISAGTLTAPAGMLSVGGNFTNNSVFAANGGTVQLTGTGPATISGSTTFNNVSIANLGGAKTVSFTAGSTQTVSGTLTINGAPNQLVTLQSTSSSPWNINPTSASVSYAAVSHSNNQGATICATHSTDGGSNTHWRISTGGACTVQFTTETASGAESTTAVAIPIDTSFTQNVDATVDYAVTGGTATSNGVDFTLPAGTATISANTTSTTIPLTIVDDNVFEVGETIIVTLSNPVNATLGSQTTFTYTILDNDVLTHVLTYNAGDHGLIIGVSPQTVNDGASGATVAAAPYDGFHFVSWSDGSTVNPRTDALVTADLTVTALFEADPIVEVPPVTPPPPPSKSAYLLLTVSAPKTISQGTAAVYTITIQNTGEADVSNVKLSFTIPKVTSLASKTASSGATPTWSCTPKTTGGSVCSLTLSRLAISQTTSVLAKLKVNALVTGSAPKMGFTVNASSGALAAKASVTKSITRIHTVQRGQTLTSLAKSYYGGTKYWARIRDANRKIFKTVTSRPPAVSVGMKLSIP